MFVEASKENNIPVDEVILRYQDSLGIPFDPNAQAFLNGRGLNPLLQNFWMAIHPLVVFLGYALVTIPYAASLVSLVYKFDWVKYSLIYLRLSWIFLGLGIIVGGVWAYEVLGWGGFWAWDPVETASLIAWLFLTACLHIVKRGDAFAKISVAISMLFVIFATFVTRSGLWQSVHAFGENPYNLLLVTSMINVILVPILMIYLKDFGKRLSIYLILSETFIFVIKYFKGTISTISFEDILILTLIFLLFVAMFEKIKLKEIKVYKEKVTISNIYLLIALLGLLSFILVLTGIGGKTVEIKTYNDVLFLPTLVVIYYLGYKFYSNRYILLIFIASSLVLTILNIFKNFYISLLLPSLLYGTICITYRFIKDKDFSKYLIHLGFIVIIFSASLATVYDREQVLNMVYNLEGESNYIKYDDLYIKVNNIYLGKTYEDYLSLLLDLTIKEGNEEHNVIGRIDENTVYGRVIKPIIIRKPLYDYYLHINYLIPEPMYYIEYRDKIISYIVSEHDQTTLYFLVYDKNDKIIENIYKINFSKLGMSPVNLEYVNKTLIIYTFSMKAFKNFENFTHEIGTIKLYDNVMEISSGNETKKERAETVNTIKINLTIKYNPLVNVVWIGCTILTLGMILRLFRRQKY